MTICEEEDSDDGINAFEGEYHADPIAAMSGNPSPMDTGHSTQRGQPRPYQAASTAAAYTDTSWKFTTAAFDAPRTTHVLHLLLREGPYCIQVQVL